MKVVLNNVITFGLILTGLATSVIGLIYLVNLDSDSTSHSRKIGSLNYDMNVVRDDVATTRQIQNEVRRDLQTKITFINETISNILNQSNTDIERRISQLNQTINRVTNVTDAGLRLDLNKLTADLISLQNSLVTKKSDPKYPWTNDQFLIIEGINLAISEHHIRISVVEDQLVLQRTTLTALNARLDSLFTAINGLNSQNLDARISSLEKKMNLSVSYSSSSSSSTGPSSSTGSASQSSSSTGSQGVSNPSYFNATLDVRSQAKTFITQGFNASYRYSLNGPNAITVIGDSITCGLWASDTSSQSGTHFVGRLKTLMGLPDPGFINSHKYDDIYIYTSKRDIQYMTIPIDKTGMDPIPGTNSHYTNNQGSNWFARGQGEMIYGPYLYGANDLVVLTVYFFVGPEFTHQIQISYYSCVDSACTSMVLLGSPNQFNNVPSQDVTTVGNNPSQRYQVTTEYTFPVTQGRNYYVKIVGTGGSSNIIGISLTRQGKRHISAKCQPGYNFRYFGMTMAETYDGVPPLEAFVLPPRTGIGGPATDFGIIALGTADISASQVATAMINIAIMVGGRIPLMFLFFPSPANNKASFYDSVMTYLGNSLNSYPVMILDLSHIAITKLYQIGYFSTLDLKGAGSSSGGDFVHPSDAGSQLIAQHVKYYLDLCK